MDELSDGQEWCPRTTSIDNYDCFNLPIVSIESSCSFGTFFKKCIISLLVRLRSLSQLNGRWLDIGTSIHSSSDGNPHRELNQMTVQTSITSL